MRKQSLHCVLMLLLIGVLCICVWLLYETLKPIPVFRTTPNPPPPNSFADVPPALLGTGWTREVPFQPSGSSDVTASDLVAIRFILLRQHLWPRPIERIVIRDSNSVWVYFNPTKKYFLRWSEFDRDFDRWRLVADRRIDD